jgi:hypothetical protein
MHAIFRDLHPREPDRLTSIASVMVELYVLPVAPMPRRTRSIFEARARKFPRFFDEAYDEE